MKNERINWFHALKFNLEFSSSTKSKAIQFDFTLFRSIKIHFLIELYERVEYIQRV